MNVTIKPTRMTTDQGALERIVMHALELRPVFRRAFLLCDIQGFTVAEAAGILDISPASVETRLDRARREMNIRMAAAAHSSKPESADPVRMIDVDR